MIHPEAALAICRALLDGSILYLWGAYAYVSTLVPAPLARQLSARLRVSQVVAVAMAVATTALLLPLRAATIGNGWASFADGATISAVLFQTSVGTAWLAQAGAAAVLVGAAICSAGKRGGWTAIASGLLLATLPLTGHAAMHSGLEGLVHRVNDTIHLLAGGAWLGSLVPVLLILPKLHGDDQSGEARVALMRFSVAGHFAVALVIASGIINLFLIIGDLPLDWSYDYQKLLSLKIGLVALISFVALTNRYILVPRLNRRSADRALTYLTVFELIAGAGIIGLVAWFGMLEPN